MKKFNYKREIGQNPFSGFMSFQHFNGEKLYSDCIISHGGLAGCETENYECYPIPDGVEENGREQGFFPDCTVAYFRVLWKDFEPKQNEFNYGFVEKILEGAQKHGQVVAFRLMPHSTCARDDVPDWLKKIIDCPKRPDGMRVKDSPKDERFLALFGNAVRAFGERFDSDERLYSMDISLAGAWGEGMGTSSYAHESVIALQDTYIKYFKNTVLIGQLANTELLNYIRQFRPVGWRGDGAGQSDHMDKFYPEWIEKCPRDSWKSAPVSFESYWWISEWVRQGWDIDKIIEKTLQWHITSFNTKSFPIPYGIKEKIDYWISKMGYHYSINSCDFEKDGKTAKVTLSLENVGVAPAYTKIPFKIKLKNSKNEYIFDTGVDIREWISSVEEKISLDLSGVVNGEYSLLIGLTDEKNIKAFFATDAEFDDGFYKLLNIKI